MALLEMTPVLRIFTYGGVLLVVAFVAGFFVLRARRRMLEKDLAGGPGFAVEELEAMRAAGRISDEEFRILRRKALGVDPNLGKDKKPPMIPAVPGLAAQQDDAAPEDLKRDNALSDPPERDDEDDIPARE